MAKKTFKAGPIANRIVRQLVQSMTPENRKAFHEGLRIATKEQIADALEEAFVAGKGGCVFSKDRQLPAPKTLLRRCGKSDRPRAGGAGARSGSVLIGEQRCA